MSLLQDYSARESKRKNLRQNDECCTYVCLWLPNLKNKINKLHAAANILLLERCFQFCCIFGTLSEGYTWTSSVPGIKNKEKPHHFSSMNEYHQIFMALTFNYYPNLVLSKWSNGVKLRSFTSIRCPIQTKKQCLRCNTFYVDKSNSPTTCSFHGHTTDQYFLLSNSISTHMPNFWCFLSVFRLKDYLWNNCVLLINVLIAGEKRLFSMAHHTKGLTESGSIALGRWFISEMKRMIGQTP